MLLLRQPNLEKHVSLYFLLVGRLSESIGATSGLKVNATADPTTLSEVGSAALLGRGVVGLCLCLCDQWKVVGAGIHAASCAWRNKPGVQMS